MTSPNADNWARLSPLLDELLDLPEPERMARLAEVRKDNQKLGDELAALLLDNQRTELKDFLAKPLINSVEPQLDSLSPTLAGQRLGAYVLESPLGQGGTGSVWRARREDGRFIGAVAIKLLHLSLLGRAGAERFKREGDILARLTHPNIAHLLDAGVSAGGQPYLVIELVDGEQIDRHCDLNRLRVNARLALFDNVLAAVAHAHTHLVIHRDIKPSNILVTPDGTVKLLDFGIAKLLEDEASAGEVTALTRDGGRVLTPEYAAPEQLRGEAITTATDVYALGVLLYQLLCGRHPTSPVSATSAEVVRATLDTEAKLLSRAVTQPLKGAALVSQIAASRDTSTAALRNLLQGDLDNIAAHALQKLPRERYSTVAAFAEDLRRYRTHETVTARPDSLGYRSRKFVRRHRLAVGAASTTLLALLAGVVGTTWQALEAQRQRDAARGAQTEAVAQTARADQQRTLALTSASEAARQRVAAELARQRAVSEAARAEAEAQRAEAERRRALAAQAVAQSEAAAARSARAETEVQLEQTRVQRAEARYMARASAASADLMSSLLADIGAAGKPLSPVQLLERGRELVAKNYAAAPGLQSELLVGLAVRYQLINRPDRELELRALGEQAARRANDANLLANALCAGVAADIDAGRTAVAQARVDEARRVIATMKSQPRLLVSHVCLNAEADLATARLDTVEAIRVSQQAVKLFEDADERDGLPYLVALGNLAYHHERAGQLAPAFEIMVKLGQTMDASGRTTTRDRLTAMINQGHLRVYFGELAEAFALFREAVQRAQGTDLSTPTADAGLARAYGVGLMHMVRDAEAVRWLSYARDRGRNGGDLYIQLEASLLLAQTHVQAGRPDEAAAALDLREATRLAAPTPPPASALAVSRVRAQIALLRGEVAQARQIMKAQLEAIDPPGVRADRNLLAKLPIATRAASAAGAFDEARRHAEAYLQCALRVARLPEQSAHVGRAWALLGEVQQQQGQPREALASRQRALPILMVSLGEQHPEAKQFQALLSNRP